MTASTVDRTRVVGQAAVCRALQRSVFLVVLLAAVLSAQATDATDQHGLTLSPEQIEIDMFYGGGTLTIEGAVGNDSDVVVVIRGPEEEETFNKKVRAGPIWISSGKVTVSGAPSLFLALSSAPISSLVDDDIINRYALNSEAIKHEMEIDAGGDDVDEDLMRDNYLALKMEQRKYQVIEDAVVRGAPDGETSPFSVELAWPRTAPPAVYEVTAYELSGGEVAGASDAELNVVKVGLPENIHAFAIDKSAQYGALAILLAVIAGFGIDFIASRVFGSRLRGAH